MVTFDWEPWLATYIPNIGRNALDIGAHMGQWTKFLASNYQHVFAVEPVPVLAKVLRDLTLANVTVLECAAWLHSCDLEFAIRTTSEIPEDTGVHSCASAAMCRDYHRDKHPIAEILRVQAHAMDDLVLEDIDFIKIDVEGGELPAIQGCTRIIERDYPTVIVECHEQENVAWLNVWLTRCGYDITIIHRPDATPEHPLWLSHVWLIAKPHKPHIWVYR